MVQALRSALAPSDQRAAQRGSMIVERPSVHASWDEDVVADIAGFDYVRAVVFTDGQGVIMHRLGRLSLTRELAESLDMSLACMQQTGLALGVGELQIGVGIFETGTTIAASARGVRVTVLAESNANLGQLLSQMRRVFASPHA